MCQSFRFSHDIPGRNFDSRYLTSSLTVQPGKFSHRGCYALASRCLVPAQRPRHPRAKAHSNRKGQVSFAANPRIDRDLLSIAFSPRLLVRRHSFYTPSIRRLPNCAPSGALEIRTLPFTNLLSIAVRVIPMPRENDRFVFPERFAS